MNSLLEVSVELSRAPYKVLIGAGAISSSGELISRVSKPCRCVVVTDSNVAPLYAEAVELSLSQAGFQPVRVTVPAGESSKSISQLGFICDAMIEAGLDRASLLIALGGGVVGDLAGFAAAVYYRGIPYIQIPTTIVSQVDSSVGGKTGVNAVGGKNLMKELFVVFVECPAIARDEITNLHLVKGVLQAGSVLVAHDVTVARS